MRMRALFMGMALVAAMALPAAAQQTQRKGGEDISGPYEVVKNWPAQKTFDNNLDWNRPSSIFAETPDHIFVVQSGVIPVAWRQFKGDELRGAQEATFSLGQPMIRPAYLAVHCGTPLRFGNDPSKWHCEKDANGKTIDSIVHQDTFERVEGAKWEHTILVLNRDGKVIEDWSQWNHLLGHPHHIMISPYDPEKHVWVVDAGSQQIYKFTHDGKKLLMTLGTNRQRSPERTGDKSPKFGDPTGIAFLPNGDFYVSDGYYNARVVKFDKNGKYLMEFGKFGKGPGELDTVHALAIANDRIYIADRANSRVSVFDLNGKFIEHWPDIQFPLFLAASKDGFIWVSDGKNNKMLKYTLDGHLVDSWGTFGTMPGAQWGTHYFNTDSEGNFYTAEVFSGRIQKFTPRQDVDQKRLIGPLASPGILAAR